MLRLLICDDAPDAREAVKVSLAEQPEIEIVGEAGNGEEAISAAADLHPDVILMDVKMPVVDGIVATKRIRDVLPRTRIVAYAGSDDTDDVMAMLEAGADAYCVKALRCGSSNEPSPGRASRSCAWLTRSHAR
jgi:DNA-binding NarL/FixJ family response regulator